MSNAQELACTYACLILSDDGIPITADKISAIVMAAKVSVESYWPSLFAKLAEKRNIEDLVLDTTLGGGGGGGGAVPATGAGVVADVAVPATQAKEEKKEEIFEESDDDIMPSLFDD